MPRRTSPREHHQLARVDCSRPRSRRSSPRDRAARSQTAAVARQTTRESLVVGRRRPASAGETLSASHSAAAAPTLSRLPTADRSRARVTDERSPCAVSACARHSSDRALPCIGAVSARRGSAWRRQALPIARPRLAGSSQELLLALLRGHRRIERQPPSSESAYLFGSITTSRLRALRRWSLEVSAVGEAPVTIVLFAAGAAWPRASRASAPPCTSPPPQLDAVADHCHRPATCLAVAQALVHGVAHDQLDSGRLLAVPADQGSSSLATR